MHLLQSVHRAHSVLTVAQALIHTHAHVCLRICACSATSSAVRTCCTSPRTACWN